MFFYGSEIFLSCQNKMLVSPLVVSRGLKNLHLSVKQAFILINEISFLFIKSRYLQKWCMGEFSEVKNLFLKFNRGGKKEREEDD